MWSQDSWSEKSETISMLFAARSSTLMIHKETSSPRWAYSRELTSLKAVSPDDSTSVYLYMNCFTFSWITLFFQFPLSFFSEMKSKRLGACA